MKKKIFSLQYKIILLTLAVAIIPTLLVGIVSYTQNVKIVENQVMKVNFNILQQMADNINNRFKAMSDLSMELWRDDPFMECLMTDVQEASELEYVRLVAQQRVEHYTVFKNGIYSVYVEADNGLVFDTMSTKNKITPEMKEELIKLRGTCVLIHDEIIDYDGTVQKVFSVLRVLKDPKNLSKSLAVIKINMLEKEISNIYDSGQLSPNSETFIMDSQDQILYAAQEIVDQQNVWQVYGSDNKEKYFIKKVGNVKCICTIIPLEDVNCKLVCSVPMEDLVKESRTIQEITIVTIAISILCCILIMFFLTNKVLRPLKMLGKSMNRLENGEFNIELPENGKDEIAQVCRNFNRMSKKLDKLINEVYLYQIRQKEAELKILHEQINPHFLYNTLNTIYWMCKMEKANESAKLINGLSKLFRLSLNSGKAITTVEKEIEYLQYYILIQEKRYEEMIRFEVEVEEDVLKCHTIKLTLQPLVENAIYHGIEKKGSRGTIRIRAYRDSEYLYFQVIDDGIGMEEDVLTAILNEPWADNKGFAVKNVHERIRLYFGNEEKQYGLSFKSSPGKGTTVTVTQPVEVDIV